MRLGRFSSFTLGVLVTAVAVGTVNYTSAASDRSINACANKSTGSLRLLKKGSCKKSESIVSWNKQGISGQVGAQGAPGVNGQNIYVVDANERTIGQLLAYFPSDMGGFVGMNGRVSVLAAGRIWMINMEKVEYMSTGGQTGRFFADASMTIPLGWINDQASTDQDTFVWDNKVYVSIGVGATLNEANPFCGEGRHFLDDQTCSSNFGKIVELREIEPLTYSPPLRIVARGS